MSEENNLEGIGGWLIFVAIGVVISPIKIAMLLITIYSEAFSTGAWEAVTTQGSDAYSPLWAPIVIGEILINCGLMLAGLYMAYQFFTKSKDFPKWFIGIAIFGLVFIVADALAIQLVLPNQPLLDSDTIKEIMRSVLLIVIWVPYMLISKRVKATFTK